MEKSEGNDINMEEKVEVITDAQPVSWRPPEDFVPFVDGQSFGLPEGWMVERRPRTNPNYIGKFDQFYYVPGTKIKFRSLKKAMNYVEERKKASDVEFNFEKPPEKVTWSLTDAENDKWEPIVDKKQVPEAEKDSWAETLDKIYHNTIPRL